MEMPPSSDPETPQDSPQEEDLERAENMRTSCDSILQEVGKKIVGQSDVLEQLMVAIFARGHCLMEGVPGLAKTTIVATLANAMELTFKRIQFTPDLMPSDITGTDIIQEDTESGKRSLVFLPGPIFAQMILADEINRTPPKTQSALLEAMQEHSVTVGDRSYKLTEPFFVLATQNPLEQEGTYPLPEAQQDRFMFHVKVSYPDRSEEKEILLRTTTTYEAEVTSKIDGEMICSSQEIVRKVPVPNHVYELVLDLCRKTRPDDPESPDFIKQWVNWGAGPRAAQYLILGGKARAILKGRFHVTEEDIRSLAFPVLRHRVQPSFRAEAENVTSDAIIQRLLETTQRSDG